MDPIDDLDRLADELELASRGALSPGAGLEGLLDLMARRSASDLLLVAGEPPVLRIGGVLQRADAPLLDGEDIEQLVTAMLPRHAQRAFQETGIADASIRLPGLGRFRVNLHHERSRAAAVVRRLPRTVPRLASLDLPPQAEALTKITQGLVLIGGATGSGKTTTMAALVEEINRRDAKHIVTIEDPIEYEHTNQRSIIQ